ncbi:MAG: hypothetical protein K0S39_2053 [Paenibacillus sp.]|jgi:hypothetical protein|nr:hypothetical protein [Paenibacillus sp.]
MDKTNLKLEYILHLFCMGPELIKNLGNPAASTST